MMSRAECGLAEAEIDLSHLDRAASWIASAKSAMSQVPNQNPLYLEDCMEAEADVVDARGNPTAATQIAEQALALLEQAGATHDLRYSDLLGRIADYYKAAGDTHKGFEYVERALAAAERDGLGDTDAAMTAVHNVASSLIGFGELKEGCSREARLVDRLESTGRTVIPAIAVLHGTCLLRAGDAAAALVWYDKGVSAAVAEQVPRSRGLCAPQPCTRPDRSAGVSTKPRRSSTWPNRVQRRRTRRQPGGVPHSDRARRAAPRRATLRRSRADSAVGRGGHPREFEDRGVPARERRTGFRQGSARTGTVCGSKAPCAGGADGKSTQGARSRARAPTWAKHRWC